MNANPVTCRFSLVNSSRICMIKCILILLTEFFLSNHSFAPLTEVDTLKFGYKFTLNGS